MYFDFVVFVWYEVGVLCVVFEYDCMYLGFVIFEVEILVVGGGVGEIGNFVFDLD